jgi:transcriptional regulator with XRE-family HTH domain
VKLLASPSPTFGQRRLARALRRLRTESGLTIDEVAEKLELSPSTVSRMETAQAGVRRPDVRELLDLYQVTGMQRQQLLQLVDESRKQPWWLQYRDLKSADIADLEAEAVTISQYSALVIPGLLQTEAYAGEVLGAMRPDGIPDRRHIELRMNRQALLTNQGSPQYSVVLGEGALLQMVGGNQVMHAQIGRLLEASELPNVTVQVLPFSAGAHPGVDGEFTIFTYDESHDPDVVYIETAVGQAYLEDPGQTARYTWVFDRLRDGALDPVRSRQVLTDIRNRR